MIELAGERIRITEDAEGTATISFDDKGTGRVCGTCTLCCKLVPVASIAKPAGKRCQHAKVGKGCAIYVNRPLDCRTWACRWLADPQTARMPRPDRCHYVIDLEYDYITAIPIEGGESSRVAVIQVWVDPAFRNAHRAPELRAYLAMRAERDHVAAIIRWSSTDAVVLAPPSMTNDGSWQELPGTIGPRNQDEADILRLAMAGSGTG
jgi:hypothetical protein